MTIKQVEASIAKNKAIMAATDSCELAEASIDREPEDGGYTLADAIIDAFSGTSGVLHELDEDYDLRRRMGVL